MSSYDRSAWLGAIAAGIAVDAAVATLLSLLVYRVKVIDQRVVEVREALRGAEGTTAETALIPKVADGVDAVLAEGLEHHLFLGRVLGTVQR
jgi:hypothetical protein